MNTGVIIARFQTPYLHDGHIHLIDEIQNKHSKLIVLLGISPITGSRNNPFDYTTREGMIKSAYPDIIVLPISDHPEDETWSRNLDNLLYGAFPNEQFILYGSRDSFIPYYSGKIETKELEPHGDFNSTEIRKQYADKVGKSEDFRKGVLYAVHGQYTKVYPTVDIAVFRNSKTEILLGRKEQSNKWRLIGGFADPEDESFEGAAQRELREEIGSVEISNLKYEMSQRINDWRYRNESDKITTLLFSCDFVFGKPTAQDDIVEVSWFKLSELTSMFEKESINTEHTLLLKQLLNQYNV